MFHFYTHDERAGDHGRLINGRSTATRAKHRSSQTKTKKIFTSKLRLWSTMHVLPTAFEGFGWKQTGPYTKKITDCRLPVISSERLFNLPPKCSSKPYTSNEFEVAFSSHPVDLHFYTVRRHIHRHHEWSVLRAFHYSSFFTFGPDCFLDTGTLFPAVPSSWSLAKIAISLLTRHFTSQDWGLEWMIG